MCRIKFSTILWSQFGFISASGYFLFFLIMICSSSFLEWYFIVKSLIVKKGPEGKTKHHAGSQLSISMPAITDGIDHPYIIVYHSTWTGNLVCVLAMHFLPFAIPHTI